MKQLNIFFYTLLFTSILSAQESMELLLDQYKAENKLSKITKQETAGFLELYTRDELEKMQAHNLLDVFKTIPGLVLTKDSLAINTFKKHKMKDIPDSVARLYINDHDMSSASYGSAFLVWADMPIEYVDHIEVYKATSSIEFGNEVGSLVIKVYTKKAQREEGGKVRLMASDNGGYDTNIYYGQTLENGLAYFVYGNTDDIKNGEYTHLYNNKAYEIKDSKKSYTLFANLLYKSWTLDMGLYHKNVDAYTGPGIHKTPSGNGVESQHYYAHLTKKFDNGLRVQLAYDHMKNDARFLDENGIVIFDPDSPYEGKWLVNDYSTVLKDDVYSVILDKKFHFSKNSLLLGAFYKHKRFSDSAYFSAAQSYIPPYTSYQNGATAQNSLDLSSIYFEDNYAYDESLHFIFSMKGDFYRYKKRVKAQDKVIARLGVIKNIEHFQIKAYATHSYIPATFVELYNDSNTPMKVNPDLDYATFDLYSGSIRYKNAGHSIEGIISHNKLKDAIILHPVYGYINSPDSVAITTYELLYKYIYNADNKLYLNYSSGKNSVDLDVSPTYSFGARLFNRYKQLDFYNELTLRGPYNYSGVSVGRSYDYTFSVKYHLSKDLSVGIRGDNVFNSGYKQVYSGYYEAIPITPQRFWLNFEALF